MYLPLSALLSTSSYLSVYLFIPHSFVLCLFVNLLFMIPLTPFSFPFSMTSDTIIEFEASISFELNRTSWLGECFTSAIFCWFRKTPVRGWRPPTSTFLLLLALILRTSRLCAVTDWVDLIWYATCIICHGRSAFGEITDRRLFLCPNITLWYGIKCNGEQMRKADTILPYAGENLNPVAAAFSCSFATAYIFSTAETNLTGTPHEMRVYIKWVNECIENCTEMDTTELHLIRLPFLSNIQKSTRTVYQWQKLTKLAGCTCRVSLASGNGGTIAWWC